MQHVTAAWERAVEQQLEKWLSEPGAVLLQGFTSDEGGSELLSLAMMLGEVSMSDIPIPGEAPGIARIEDRTRVSVELTSLFPLPHGRVL